MVQYIITPWRNRRELFNVRRAFYPSSEIGEAISNERRHEAVEMVSVWVQRGNCPHSVESTALLVSAMLNETVGASAYAIRAAYSAAFSRFVTGLLDGYQDKRRKLSMYSIAKNIGLPATFVELRHQCTHEELPSLTKLRAAAERSLLWIWDHYWKNLEVFPPPVDVDECRTVLQDYLQWRANSQPQEQQEDRERDFVDRLQKWKKEQLLDVLMGFNHMSTTQANILLQSLRLSRAIISRDEGDLAFDLFTDELDAEEVTKSLEAIRADVETARITVQGSESVEGDILEPKREEQQDEDMEDDDDDGDETGWQMWKGAWVPKPIGVV